MNPTSPTDKQIHTPQDLGIEVTTHDAAIPFLPHSLAGTTVAQLSDFHRGCGNSDALIRAAVAQTNALEADYIFLTGDFVDGKKKDILPIAEMMSGLTARRGIYAVLGNHDQRDDPKLLRTSLEGVGIPVLMNEARELEPGFWLGGVDDLLEGEPDLNGTLAQLPEGAASILLSHNPNALNKVSEDRPLLILSGHTHGAQIALPFPTPYMVCRLHLGTRYVHGWYERGEARLYVNRGIGVTGSGFFARRYKCPPEITLFTLKPSEKTLE